MKTGIVFGLGASLAVIGLASALEDPAPFKFAEPKFSYRCTSVAGYPVSRVVVVAKLGTYISAQEVVCGDAV